MVHKLVVNMRQKWWSDYFHLRVNSLVLSYDAPSVVKFRIRDIFITCFWNKKTIFCDIVKIIFCDIKMLNFWRISVFSFFSTKKYSFAILKISYLRHWKLICCDIKNSIFLAALNIHVLRHQKTYFFATFKKLIFCDIKKPFFCDVKNLISSRHQRSSFFATLKTHFLRQKATFCDIENTFVATLRTDLLRHLKNLFLRDIKEVDFLRH